MLICATNLLQQYTTALNAINNNQFAIEIINADDALVKAHIKLYHNYTKSTI